MLEPQRRPGLLCLELLRLLLLCLELLRLRLLCLELGLKLRLRLLMGVLLHCVCLRLGMRLGEQSLLLGSDGQGAEKVPKPPPWRSQSRRRSWSCYPWWAGWCRRTCCCTACSAIAGAWMECPRS